jgi:hypothetical protein
VNAITENNGLAEREPRFPMKSTRACARATPSDNPGRHWARAYSTGRPSAERIPELAPAPGRRPAGVPYAAKPADSGSLMRLSGRAAQAMTASEATRGPDREGLNALQTAARIRQRIVDLEATVDRLLA